MLKGHADIYLMDAKTGEVVDERHEDNIVTNAVQELISMNPYGLMNGLQSYLPLATKALGGVLLFPEAINESASNYFAKGQWPTGYASNGTDTRSDPLRGNFNANESYATSNGYRLVWDFGTADANGEIACVCLTSDEGGRGYDMSNYDYTASMEHKLNDGTVLLFKNGNSAETPQAYHNGSFYKIDVTDDSTRGEPVTCVMKKWTVDPHRQPVGRAYSVDITSTDSIDLSSTHIVSVGSGYYASSRYRRYTYWDESGCRIFQSDYLQASERSGYYYVCTIGWDGSVSEVAIPYADMVDRVETNRSVVRDDWCYIPWSRTENNVKKKGFYAVQLSNIANVVELESEFTGNVVSAEGGSDNSIYSINPSNAIAKIPVNTGNWTVVLNNGKIVKEWDASLSYDTSAIYGLIGSYYLATQTYSGAPASKALRSKTTYLATINNLASPITKTADRTLKIVYTLTEA